MITLMRSFEEFFLIFIVGLFILVYVLDAVVDPLSLNLATPYHYFNPQALSLFPFTTASIIIKALALFMSALLLMSLLGIQSLSRGVTLLVLSGLMQLYAIQDVATGAEVIPLEWSLSFTLTGVALLFPAALFIVIGLFKRTHESLQEKPTSEPESGESDDEVAE